MRGLFGTVVMVVGLRSRRLVADYRGKVAIVTGASQASVVVSHWTWPQPGR